MIFKNKRKNLLKKIKDDLSKNNSCYVLLTCSNPTKTGEMLVEICYEGDETLTAYLIDNAKNILLEKINENENKLNI